MARFLSSEGARGSTKLEYFGLSTMIPTISRIAHGQGRWIWTRCKVDSLDGKPFDEKGMPKLLNYYPRSDYASTNGNARNFLAVKKSDEEIYLFTVSNGSFIYNVKNCSLRTLVHIKLPLEFLETCHPPMVIHHWIYLVDDLFGRLERFNMVDGSSETLSLELWEPHYLSPDESVESHLVIRTDGNMSGDVAEMIHIFRPDGFEEVGGEMRQIICYICVSVRAENEEEELPAPTYKYFALPFE